MQAPAARLNIIAPLSGVLVPLESVPDPVFAQKMVGDGLYMRVQRGKKTLEFKLDAVVCEASSTARMIRPR